MRRPGRRLSVEEQEVWALVARTVTPLVPAKRHAAPAAVVDAAPSLPIQSHPAPMAKKVKGRVPPAPTVSKPIPAKPSASKPTGEDRLHLDGSWERRIAKGTLVPDFSLDLHGSSLDQAYVRLMHGLTQAKAMGARVVLVVTGKPRPVDAADRGTARGAIRAKVSDWLGASDHASDIVALRGAHRRHGGPGALYVVLKKRR